MKKFKVFGLLFIFFALVGCNNDLTKDLDQEEQEIFINNKLESRYGFIGTSQSISPPASETLKSLGNLDNEGTCFNFTDASYKIYTFPVEGDAQKQDVYESILLDDGVEIITYICEVFNTLDQNGEGLIEVIYEDGSMASFVSHENSLSSLRFPKLFKPKIALAKLCQREAGEGTGDCFSRESREFQIDFISIVAWHSNPTIPIIVAALCSC